MGSIELITSFATSMNRSRRFVTSWSALFLWALAAGCQTWSTIDRPSPGSVPTYGRLRVTGRDGNERTVRNARIVNDTIYGMTEGDSVESALPVNSIANIEKKEISVARTGLAVVGGLALFLTTLLLLVINEVCEQTSGCS